MFFVILTFLAPILVFDCVIAKEIYIYSRTKRTSVLWLGLIIFCTILGFGYTSGVLWHSIGLVLAAAPMIRLFMTFFKKTDFRYSLGLTAASIASAIVVFVLFVQIAIQLAKPS